MVWGLRNQSRQLQLTTLLDLSPSVMRASLDHFGNDVNAFRTCCIWLDSFLGLLLYTALLMGSADAVSNALTALAFFASTEDKFDGFMRARRRERGVLEFGPERRVRPRRVWNAVGPGSEVERDRIEDRFNDN
jgi:hypothetical protein